MNDDMQERTRILLGEQGLARLAQAHVLVAGVGGVGGAVAEALARAGVGAITLLDHDTVALSNLNRQLVALHSTLGRRKAEAMAERMRDIRPDIRVEARLEFVRPETADALIAEGGFDFVLDCIDSIACKAALIHACQRREAPVYSSLGAGGRLDVSKVGVSSLNQTHTCALARELRRALRERGAALNVPVVYSWETPIKALPHQPVGGDVPGRSRAVNGTISYMPNLFGMMLAGTALKGYLDSFAA
ncbi:MAG: tRNA threonylcarbamoyladenosine dehydratase [Pseudomonadota bacterium]